MEERLPKGSIGGQAVIEGVMMKGKESYSVAVRKPDKKIEVKLQQYQSFGDKHAWARVPFIRGVVNFAESMVIGMKTLSYSSSFYEEEEQETKADRLIKDVFKEKAESVIMGITLFLSVIIAIALFMMLPAALGEFIGKWVDNRLLLSLIEGIIRLIIFIIYVALISQMEDIKRVFMYHGAEHKTINCYESGEELTPENVAKHSRYHKRCGTSFLFIVMVVSIIIFMFITADQMWLRFLLRLLLIPAVAGISYEFIRLAGRTDNVVMNVLSKPGMWIQRLTTKEPQEEMIQVAIISVESVLYGMPYVNAVNEAQGIGINDDEADEEQNIDDVAQADGLNESYEEAYDEFISEEVQEEIEEAIEMLEESSAVNEVVEEAVIDVTEQVEDTTEIVTEKEEENEAVEEATAEKELAKVNATKEEEVAKETKDAKDDIADEVADAKDATSIDDVEDVIEINPDEV
ncbi:MAG: DUF1385 domain-containing protein [Lachnospiraceae bacterium]|nr:DUF1385 domain-containing protein [Lachnospiraceae bacterium]